MGEEVDREGMDMGRGWMGEGVGWDTEWELYCHPSKEQRILHLNNINHANQS